MKRFHIKSVFRIFLEKLKFIPKCQELRRGSPPQKKQVLANLKIVPVQFLLFLYAACLAPVGI